MIERGLTWVIRRARPREGWIPLILLAVTVGLTARSIINAAWVPEAAVIRNAFLVGLLLAVVLAERRTHTLTAWGLILGYGLTVVSLSLARLWPLSVIFAGWEDFAPYTREQLALAGDRWNSWWLAFLNQGSSQETIVFAFGLGLAAWLLSAFVGWTAFRQKRPLVGLLALGVAITVNSYFSNAPTVDIVIFVGLATICTAFLSYSQLEQGWDARGLSYSDQVQLDLTLVAGGLALVLTALTLIVPSINPNAITRYVRQNPSMEALETTLEALFAGVRPAQRGGADDSVGGTGLMPRSFLLGNPPELYETIAMTATVETAGIPTHWRAHSYDVYTGRGWAHSAESEDIFAAGHMIPLPPASSTVTVTQEVHWLLDNRLARYTLGLPLMIDQPASVRRRGVDDFSRILGQGDITYKAVSRISVASPAELREVQLEGLPASLLARYTSLPDEMPERIRQLAREVTAGATTPFDQAVAIETFLRQYPYSLEVPAPPDGADPVDYFLFELQEGYCDYFASSMVVLARSQGIPARLGLGYRATPPSEDGVQIIRQIDAHSWAEVYFGDYGWVEFEPTASFPSSFEGVILANVETEQDTIGPNDMHPPSNLNPLPIPEQTAPARRFPWLTLAGLLAIAVVLFYMSRRSENVVAGDEVAVAFSQLQSAAASLRIPHPPWQTPAEFKESIDVELAELEGTFLGRRWLSTMLENCARIIDLYTLRQYANHNPIEARREALRRWDNIRIPFRILNIQSRIIRLKRLLLLR